MSQPDSLVRRLAGPSTGKAGVKQDQEEINRIIAEASKGSKFYENEKKKDKELTEKIEHILKQRDELMKHADIHKLEMAADKLLNELEEQRDLTQTIVHVDLDSFYAAVEVLDNPELKGKAFGVGYGVLSTASYEARKYGVRSAMPGFIAKKLCPDLIFVKTHYDRYSELSRQVMSILREYDPNLMIGGMDEAYLNITQYCDDHELEPYDCVSKLRAHVHQDTKLTISAGIASNKMLAKICSDKNKPNGQYYLPPNREAILDFTRDLSIRKIPGIGRISERLLDSIGIKTCGDVYKSRATVSLMDKQFGLRFLLRTYLGIASNIVEPGQREERKSVGVETTFTPLSDQNKILEKLSSVAADLEGDLERTGWAGRTITLKYKLDTYQVNTRAKSMNRWITKKEDLFAIGQELLMAEMPLTIRLIGLRATKLKDLRANPEKGIKRFFQDVSASPNKKAKISHAYDDEEDVMPGFREEMDSLEVHGEDEADYDDPEHAIHYGHEQDHRLPVSPAKASLGIEEEKLPLPMYPERWGLKVGKDDSKPVSSASSNPPPPKPKSKQQQMKLNLVSLTKSNPTSMVKKSVPKAREQDDKEINVQERLICPLCSITLNTDNAGLNTHIDWCLSRNAIKEASG